MQAVSRLLIRNAARFDGEAPVLWLDADPDGGWGALCEAGVRAQAHCSSWGAHRALEVAGAVSAFGCVPEGPLGGHVIVSLPRGRDRLAMLLDAVAAACAPGATVWLAGENRAGIRSCEPLLAQRFGTVRRADTARKCVLYRAADPAPGLGFDLENYVVEWRFERGGDDLRVASLPGVFAHGRLDDGTALLLPLLDEALPATGRFADIGSGCGIIGACLATAPGRQVTLVDDDALALFSSRRTLALNGLDGVVLPSDGLSGLEGRFDALVSNPPFHQGVRADTGLAPRLFADLPKRLGPGGVLLLVVNRHLPYGRWLQSGFARTDVLAENGRYRVVRAERAR